MHRMFSFSAHVMCMSVCVSVVVVVGVWGWGGKRPLESNLNNAHFDKQQWKRWWWGGRGSSWLIVWMYRYCQSNCPFLSDPLVRWADVWPKAQTAFVLNVTPNCLVLPPAIILIIIKKKKMCRLCNSGCWKLPVTKQVLHKDKHICSC